MRNTKYVPISPEVHKANKIETLEDYMKEWNCSQYEAAFDLTFEFYASETSKVLLATEYSLFFPCGTVTSR